MYNHKGGVAKTTTTLQLAWAMAAKGLKVLLVDCDAQCNLTQYALGPRIDASGHTWESFFSSLPTPHTLGDMLETAQSPGLAPGFAYPVATFPRTLGAGGAHAAGGTGQIHLIIGDPNIIHFEQTLSKVPAILAFNAASTDAPRILGALYHQVLMSAHAYRSDVVIFDLSPSISLMNQLLLMTSDVIVVPCNPDFFSNSALKAMLSYISRDPVADPSSAGTGSSGGTISAPAGSGAGAGTGRKPFAATVNFYREVDTLRIQCAYHPNAAYPLPILRPFFAGTIMSKYHQTGFKDNGSGQVEFAAGAALGGMRRKIAASAVAMRSALSVHRMAPTLAEANAIPHATAEYSENHNILNLPDFAGMTAIGHKLGFPVPFLPVEQKKGQKGVIGRLCDWSERCREYFDPRPAGAPPTWKSKQKAMYVWSPQFPQRVKQYRTALTQGANTLLDVMALRAESPELKSRLTSAATYYAYPQTEPFPLIAGGKPVGRTAEYDVNPYEIFFDDPRYESAPTQAGDDSSTYANVFPFVPPVLEEEPEDDEDGTVALDAEGSGEGAGYGLS